MSELLREIQEDIRRERLEKLWHGFGKIMVGVSIAIIAVTIVIVVMQNRNQAKAMEQTAQFMKGIDRLNIEDYEGAIAAFDVLTVDPHSPYYGLAMLRKAQAQKAGGDQANANKTYQELAGQESSVAGLASMLAPRVDDKLGNPSKQSPFYYTQREWEAWQLMQKGKKAEATEQWLALRNDSETPYSMRQRVEAVLHHIAPEQIMNPSSKPESITHE